MSPLLLGRTQFALLEAAIEGDLRLVTSPAPLKELRGVLSRPHLATRLERHKLLIQQAISLYAALAERIDPPPLATRISRLPDNDAILALAAAGQANFIVCGYRELSVFSDPIATRSLRPLGRLLV